MEKVIFQWVLKNMFPEINFDKVEKIRGMDITICTSAKNNNEAIELLKSFNMPFKESKNN